MNRLEAMTEHVLGKKVFTIKKEAHREECNICLGHGRVILGDTVETSESFMCPKCKGTGYDNSTRKMVYIPIENPVEIFEVKVKISQAEMKTSYKTKNEDGIYHRNQEYIFETFEEAVAYCELKNHPMKKMNIDDIIITSAFSESKPSPDKINAKLAEYNKTGKLGQIVVNKDDVLIDGYITYKICKLHDIKEVEVKVEA